MASQNFSLKLFFLYIVLCQKGSHVRSLWQKQPGVLWYFIDWQVLFEPPVYFCCINLTWLPSGNEKKKLIVIRKQNFGFELHKERGRTRPVATEGWGGAVPLLVWAPTLLKLPHYCPSIGPPLPSWQRLCTMASFPAAVGRKTTGRPQGGMAGPHRNQEVLEGEEHHQ